MAGSFRLRHLGTSLALLLLQVLVKHVSAFYLPGVAPRAFKEGQSVQIKVQTLVSPESELQFDYYQLPFCQPTHIVDVPENLGEALTGDRAHTSAFEAKMRVNEYCKTMCRKEYTAQQVIWNVLSFLFHPQSIIL
jgi:transmembrane 9 superfamily member 2/4